MAEFLNDKLRNSVVSNIRCIPTKKISESFFDKLHGQLWKVISAWRGKETKIVFYNEKEKHTIILHHFKAGCFKFYDNKQQALQDNEYVESLRFEFILQDGSIFAHIDTFHQSYWYWTNEESWGLYRSPDIIVENNAWRENLYNLRKRAYMKQPLYELMMHQKFFNGINNFLRSEILARTTFPPWISLSEVLDSREMRNELFKITHDVLIDVYLLGGAQFGIWKNPFGFKSDAMKRWIKVYNIHYSGHFGIIDKRGKFLWVHNKWHNKWYFYTQHSQHMSTTDI